MHRCEKPVVTTPILGRRQGDTSNRLEHKWLNIHVVKPVFVGAAGIVNNGEQHVLHGVVITQTTSICDL